MSKRKRSRKSKLEIRDTDFEYEVVSEQNDDTTPILQKVPRTVLQLEYPEIPLSYEHDYCQRGSQRFAQLVRGSSIIRTKNRPKFSNVDINFEQTQTRKRNRVRPIKEKRPLLLKKMASTSKKKKTIKTYLPKNLPDKNSMKLCKYDPQSLLNESSELAASSPYPADKILDVIMKNLWGNVLYTPDVIDDHERLIQLSFELWQVWYNSGRFIRGSPLFYQCHICNLAWWRLQPFRDHIKIHDTKTLKVSLNENIHECMIIASEDSVKKLIYIDIDGDCWKCGRDLEFHRKFSEGYSCYRCKNKQYTCSSWRNHATKCLYDHLQTFCYLERQCSICQEYMNSVDLVEKHMVLAHSVMSDVIVPVTTKQCFNCDAKYFTYNMHNCFRSSKNNSCEFCFRKYARRPLAVNHMFSPHNDYSECRVCGKALQKNCQETKHILERHKNNYCLAFKCTLCSDQCKLFASKESIKMHRNSWHQKKADNRRSFYEMMLVPKNSLEKEVVEEPFRFDETVEPSTETVEDIHDESEKKTIQVLSADIDIIVDEVDIKKEPIYDENGEIDYEEMLRSMFSESTSQDTEDKEKTDTNLEENEPDLETQIAFNDEPSDIEKKFDIGNVKIKTEPTDDIDIIEHPIEIVKVKSEPIDDDENSSQDMEVEETQREIEEDSQSKSPNREVETLTVKVEPDIDMDDIASGNIRIKCESSCRSDEDTSNSFDKILTNLNSQDWATDEINPDELTVDVKNPSSLYKKKKIYACSKCGYTAHFKHYSLHMASKCSVSPGISESYLCTKCGLTFVMFRNYVLHFDTHGYEVMSCPKCGEEFDQLVKLLSHVQKHIKNSFVLIHVLNKGGEESSKSNKEFKCQECREVVPNADMFRHWEAHLTLKTTEKPNMETSDCQVKEESPELTVDCERVTMNNKQLESATLKLAIDQLQSTTSVDKQCGVCYRSFSRRCDVKRHIVEHLLMDAHVLKAHHKYIYNGLRCQICGECFSKQENYKFHMREHGSMPIFKCELCDKTFSDSSNFAKHKKTHGVRVMQCDLCRKKFHSRLSLQKHIIEHSKDAKIKCVHCPATFKSKPEYKRHRYQHITHKFKCILCDISFKALQQKWDHDWEVHKERKLQADCPICFKSFRKLQDVRNHARSEHRASLKLRLRHFKKSK